MTHNVQLAEQWLRSCNPLFPKGKWVKAFTLANLIEKAFLDNRKFTIAEIVEAARNTEVELKKDNQGAYYLKLCYHRG